MSSRLFFYCLKVWLASVLLGPILLWGCLLQGGSGRSWTFADFLLYWGVTIMTGIVYSGISFVLFWVLTILLYRQHWPVPQLRIAEAMLALVLTMVPFLVLFETNNFNQGDRAAIFSCYLLPILAGIFFYRFPRPEKSKV
jgi:hypothetical protein